MNSRILPLVALLVAIVIFFAYVQPTWSGSIAETRAAIENNDQALAAAERFSRAQNELAAERNAIDPSLLDQLSAFLPDSVDNVGLILDLNALAAKSGLSLSNIDVISGSTPGSATAPGALPVRANNPVGTVDLAVSAIGTYASLQQFLSSLEKSARLLDVRDILVEGSNTGVYEYQMTIRIYWLR